MTHDIPALSPRDAVVEEHLAITWHCAALLLSPPHPGLLSQLESVHRATHRLPDSLGGPLRATVVHVERVPIAELEQEYLHAFDGSGLDVAAVTRLSAALEVAASAGAETGVGLVREELADLEKLQSWLLAAESGWAGAVNAIMSSLTHLPVPEPR